MFKIGDNSNSTVFVDTYLSLLRIQSPNDKLIYVVRSDQNNNDFPSIYILNNGKFRPVSGGSLEPLDDINGGEFSTVNFDKTLNGGSFTEELDKVVFGGTFR